jgi:DNA-binding response OmpR family regulator
MQVLVADDELTSRVMVETALRERGHSVRNCDDGFEAAKILSGAMAPRVAIISNSLYRLRGLDVCRFLCATGKKTGVYVILLTDVIDMELVELCRRAGVDDIVPRSISAASLHYRLDIASRVVELEGEIRRIQGILHGLASFESPLDKKAKALRDANAALLESAKKKTDATDEKRAAYRGMPVATENVQKLPDEPGIRNLLVPDEPPNRPKPATNLDDILYRPIGKPRTPAKAPAPEMSPEEIANAVLEEAGRNEPSSPSPQPEDAHQTVLAGAEQLQNEELASEELIHPFEFDDLILNVFSGMGVTLKTELPPKPIPAEGAVFISWVGVLIPGTASWLDVLLLSGEKSARAVTGELLGQSKAGDAEVIEMFAELQNMVQGALRRYLEENGHKSVLQLSIPRAVKLEKAPDIPAELLPIVESGFSFGGEAIVARMYEHKESRKVEDVHELQLHDLVCDAVQKPRSKDNLLFPGTIIRTKELTAIEAVKESVKPFRALHVSPFLSAVGDSQMLD